MAPITLLPTNTFYDCSSLASVVLPDTITEIGLSAFNKCGLRSLVLPSGVRSIGRSAFSSCERLETLVLLEGLESLGDVSIIYCPNLQRVVIPASVTYIDDENVYDCGDAVVVTPRGSYAWNWATGWGIPGLEPDEAGD